MPSRSHARSTLRSVPVLLALLGILSALTAVAHDEALATSVPEITIAVDNTNVYEGQTATFTLTASRPAPIGGLNVTIKVTEIEGFEGGIAQGDLGTKTVTFRAGASTATHTIETHRTANINVDGGSNGEPEVGTFSVALPEPTTTDYTVGDPDWAVANLFPEEFTSIQVSISASPAITEGGTAVFTVTPLSAPRSPRTVNVQITDSGDFAEKGQDGSKTVSITSGAAVTLSVETEDDGTDELDGRITATISNGLHYTIGTKTASVAVRDNDEPPPFTVTIARQGASSVVEGSDAVFKVTASPTPVHSLTVKVAVTQTGSFIAAGDVTTHDVVITGTPSALLRIATMNDSVHEPDGRVTATVSTDSAYGVGSTRTATTTVTDDDTPAVTVTRQSAAVTEGTGAVFTLSASPTPHSSLTVTLGVNQSGSFVDAADIGDQTVTIPTSGSATHTVPTIDDSADEANGSVIATVKGGTGYTVGSPSSATTTVNDDDDPAKSTITITHQSSSVTEGTAAVFNITANPAPANALTVKVAISQSGSFIASGDVTTHNVVIAASTPSKQLSIATINDSNDEPDGSVTATVNTHSSYTRRQRQHRDHRCHR